ncbi:MAG: tRNA (guanosine(37)-N1)-methyltransferase TrmD [Candidatus Omnitrophota bacterium]|mgnify:FL=1|nr:tRNA (guanosine(37)-N1)-methyltransferase TrmD [Candidatus Omnitrophota bacterium]RKY33931.1 MAG: tRNA (guanosine(37)-N1)-methyltransferase TrmD [Candidatus Omnitrophota bacterium]RKY46481.1 MAG: tRNA (guanosine(37)-N1)-methyltransferase TrmD [Candidatus Omnitrophota bacterium]HDN86623.1 tRNA (guanosine(37)-N1)-methyltransferase TrmD [Candidatus Omnitrophota bacterium]
MIIDVITIFPQMFKPILEESIIKRAQQKGLVRINLINLRDYSGDPHRKVDGSPYGGGPGMVFKCQPLFSAVEDVLKYKVYPKKRRDTTKRIILFTPKGRLLNQELVKKFLKYQRLILLAPRYEGVDERVRKYLAEDEISIGDYVLSGGELPCMVFIDCLVRLLPGVVSNFSSVKKESFQDYLLDYPVYTRPQNFRGLMVPKILLSGDHDKIEKWRIKKAEELTKKLRPDLWKKRVYSRKI